MPELFIGARLAVDGELLEGHALLVDEGVIRKILDPALAPPEARRVALDGGILAPGFIDTQVNGGGGVLFNDEPTVAGIAAIGAAHRAYGTTGFLPTLISDDHAVIHRALRAVEDAIAQGVPGVLGIHIEGPFLNTDRRGIHEASKIRSLDEEDLALLTSLRRGRTLITLAPEMTEPASIRRLRDAGVIVAAGHTDATYAQTVEGFANGITGVTHLFNAMSPMTSRAPGSVGAALADQSVWCGIIVDGHHVDPVMLRLAMRTRPLDRFMLVTDAMPTVGSTSPRFVLQGKPIEAADGVCRSADGTLAGADLDMATAVRNAVAMLGLSPQDALAIGASSAAHFLGLSATCGRLAAGQQADLVHLTDDLDPKGVWIAGRLGGQR